MDFLKKILSSPYFHGQLISVALAASGFFASLLSDHDANFPLFMSFLLYALLTSFLVRRLYIFRSINLSNKWYMYTLIAIFDVEANFLIIYAYNYTSMTSVALLDCFTIPCAFFLSFIFLRAKYTRFHFIGTFIALLGVVCTVLSDLTSHNASTEYPNAVFGDFLTILAAILYGCSNVLQEKLVKFGEIDEFLGMLGLNGSVIALIQGMILDLRPFLVCKWEWFTILYMIAFVSLLFFMYTKTSYFLQSNDAVVFNLSILTADVYSVVIAYIVFGYLVGWLYVTAFFLSTIGILIYYSVKSPVTIPSTNDKPIQEDITSPVYLDTLPGSPSPQTNTNSKSSYVHSLGSKDLIINPLHSSSSSQMDLHNGHLDAMEFDDHDHDADLYDLHMIKSDSINPSRAMVSSGSSLSSVSMGMDITRHSNKYDTVPAADEFRDSSV